MPKFKIKSPDGRTITIEAADEATAVRGAQEWAKTNPPARQAGVRYGNLVLPTGASPTAPVRPATAQERRARPAPPARGQRTQREGEAYARGQAGSSGDVQLGLGSGVLKGIAALGDLGQIASNPGAFAAGLQGPMPSQALEQSGVTYAPTTDSGRLAEGAGMMLPNALFPGSAPARVAAVAIPALTGEGSRIATREMGYDEQSQANMRALGQVAGALATGVRPSAPRAPGARPPAPPKPVRLRAPERRVGQALERATERAGLNRAQVAEQIRAGTPPWMIPGASDIAEVAAQHPGPARGALRTATDNAVTAAGEDVRGAVANTLGGRGDYFSTVDNMLEAKRVAAARGMEQFGQQQIPLNPSAVQALRSDLARTALRDQATNLLASADDAERASGAQLNRLADDLLDRPGQVTLDIRSAQDVSYALREASSSAYAAGAGGRGKALKDLANAIRGNAREASPDYARWLKDYGDASDNAAAMDMGRRIFREQDGVSGTNAETIQRDLAEMGPAAIDHYRKGVGEAILAQMRASRGNVGAMRQLLRSEEFAARARIAFPGNTFDDFMAQAEGLVARQDAANRILGGSQSAFRLQGRADLESQGVDPVGYALEAVTADPQAMARRGIRDAIGAIPRQDRSILGNTDMNAMLGEALTNPDVMLRLIRAAETDPQAAVLIQSARQNPQFAAAIEAALRAAPVAAVTANAASGRRPAPPAPPQR